MVRIKTSKNFGNDEISSYFLKLAIPFNEKSLAFVFNSSLETSHFPDSWKNARIKQVFKEGGMADKSKYYPISVLLVISRLFEKHVFSQLYQ